MADPTIRLKVLLEAAGIKPTTDQLKNLNKEMDKVKASSSRAGKGSNKLKRNLEGVGKESLSTGKGFARMSQGMGGLVQAYATVAANVFALSSAFLVLRRAADLSSMIKSAEDFSNRFGVSVTRITKQMQEASGGALSFADALPIINKAISAGIGTQKLEELTQAATKAAQTFGGSTTEALNRFISASQRGRVEIIQTLGIVIKTEQAYKDYGASIGKTALELSAFDRQQAILNATIAESKNVFDGVTIDPNPFQQLLTTITDLKDVMATFVTDTLTPLINLFNQSAHAAGVLIAIVVKSVAGRIFPALGDQIVETQAKSVESTRKALAAAEKAKRVQQSFQNELGKTSKDTSLKGIKERDSAFRKSLGTRIKLHKAFTKTIFDQENKLQADVLTSQRAAIARELAARVKGKGQQKIFIGTSDVELKKQLNTLNQIGASVERANISTQKLNASMKQTTTQITSFGLKAKAVMASFRAETARAASLYRTGFAQTFIGVNENIFKSIGRVGRAWGKFALDVASFKGSTIIGSFGRAAGRTAGLIAGSLTAGIGALSSMLIVIELVRFAWEKWGDSIRGITPAQRSVITASEEFKNALEEVNDRTAEGIVLLNDNMPASLKKLRDALRFTAGTFRSITDAIIEFQKALVSSLNNVSPDQALINLKALRTELNALERAREFFITDEEIRRELTSPKDLARIKELKVEIKSLTGILKELGTTGITQFQTSLDTAIKLARTAGFSNISGILEQEIDTAVKNGLVSGIQGGEKLAEVLKTGINTGNIEASLAEVKRLFGDNTEAFAAFSARILNLVKGFNNAISSVTATTDRALGSLSEVNGRITTFVGGLDKVRASSAPNKEIAAFILDINRELKVLKDTQDGITNNSKLSELFGDPTELSQIKALLGFASNEIVTIQQAQEKSAAIQNKLVSQAQTRLLNAQKLKVLSVELNNINIKEIKTDAQRLTQIKERQRVQLEITKQSIIAANADIAAQRVVIQGLRQAGASAEELAVQQATLDVYESQLTALELKEKIQKASLDHERESAEIRKETLDSIQKANNFELQAAKLAEKITTNSFATIAAEKNIFALEKKSLELKKQQIQLEINDFEINEKTTEQNQKRLFVLQSELALIEEQNRQLERQRLINDAKQAGVDGTTIFSEAGIDFAVKFFIRKLQDEIRGLKSTFQILGEGFATTINNTFDTAVDNLLEGGKDFGRTVIEALKAGLRETIGEAIKSRIREGIATILGANLESTAQKQAREMHEAEQMSRGEAKKAIEDNTKAISANTAKDCCSIDNTSPLAVSGRAGPDIGNSLEGIADINKDSKNRLEGVIDLIGAGNQTAEQAKGEALANTQSIIGVLFSLISTIISTSAGSIGKLFGGATGGIAPGGLSQIPKLANGGITRAPSLAVIGEGKNDEAVVPLPNNRAIPVDLNGAQGDTIMIEQNFDFSNSNAGTVAQLRAEARAIQQRTFNQVFTEINKGGKYAKISGRR